MFYYKWKKYINDNIEIVPLELKGRGKRIDQKFSLSMKAVVDDLYQELISYLDAESDKPYALFGHSMGSTIVFELAHKLQEEKVNAPVHLFFSGGYPPEYNYCIKRIHDISPEAFKEEILSMGVTPIEIFENESLASIFVPILRADYKVLEEYTYVEYDKKLSCDISVFYGLKDRKNNDTLLFSWLGYSTGETKFYSFDSGHFFVIDCMERVVETVNSILMSI